MNKCKDCGDILGTGAFCHRCRFVSNGGSETAFEIEQTRKRRREIYSIGSQYFRCPTNGRVIQGSDHDDKVLCVCGKTNPKLLEVSPKSIEVHKLVTVHVKRWLSPATVDEYLEQKDRDEAVKENAAPQRKLYIIRVAEAGTKKWVVFDEETVTVVHGNGTQAETIDLFLKKRPGAYKYVRYSGSMRISEMAMTVGGFRQKLEESKRRAGAKT